MPDYSDEIMRAVRDVAVLIKFAFENQETARILTVEFTKIGDEESKKVAVELAKEFSDRAGRRLVAARNVCGLYNMNYEDVLQRAATEHGIFHPPSINPPESIPTRPEAEVVREVNEWMAKALAHEASASLGETEPSALANLVAASQQCDAEACWQNARDLCNLHQLDFLALQSWAQIRYSKSGAAQNGPRLAK